MSPLRLAIGCVAFVACALVAPLSANAQDRAAVHLQELGLLSPAELAQTRRNCAMNLMPKIFEKVRRGSQDDAARAGLSLADLPAVSAYCIETVRISARRELLADLYINLALQEQGYSSLHFAEQAQLLRNDEAGQTTARILRAALAGQSRYVSITNVDRELPCPLAFDAGYVWAFRNPTRPQPYTLSRTEADAIARRCYAPQTQSVVIQGRTLSAQQAGVYAGAYFGKEAARSNAR